MSRLAPHYKILWVTPPLHWRSAIHLGGSGASSRGVRKLSPSFWTYAPERYLPTVYRSKGVEGLFDKIRVKRIKSLLSSMGIKQLVLYIFNPMFASQVGRFNEQLVCYHAYDEYTFSEIDLPISTAESELIKKSDVVLMHSKTLCEKKGKLNPETYYIPNGVDFDHYRRISEESNIILKEFDSIPRPRIGYVGYIKSQLDLALLLGIARKRKDWSIVLVGPVNTNHLEIQETVQLLRQENNVHFLGGKRPEDLPKYINKLDVCLMCYRKTAYTKYIYPLKLHEYLACGKPIVATCLDNLREFEEVLYFADGLEDWIEKIEKAYTDSTTELEVRRIGVAKENSWEARIEAIRSILESKLAGRI